MRSTRVYTDKQREEARVRAKAWYYANRDRSISASIQWRADNIEHVRAKASANFQANKELRQQQNADRRKANPRADYEYHKAYREKNKDKIVAYRSTHKKERLAVQNNRRARAYDGGKLPSNIVETLLNKQRFRCANCLVDLRKSGQHLDHRESLSKGGTNTESNVELLCPTCNLRKRAKDPIDWAQQNGRLL